MEKDTPQARYYAKNKARCKAWQKAWAKKNPERVRAKSKAWRERNPERAKAQGRASAKRRYAKDPERLRAINRAAQKRMREANPERCRSQKNGYYKERRENAILALGGQCVRCACADIRVLEIDHKFGDGRAERQSGIDRTVLYNRIVAKPETRDRYQVLCSCCHTLKSRRFEDGPYPYASFAV